MQPARPFVRGNDSVPGRAQAPTLRLPGGLLVTRISHLQLQLDASRESRPGFPHLMMKKKEITFASKFASAHQLQLRVDTKQLDERTSTELRRSGLQRCKSLPTAEEISRRQAAGLKAQTHAHLSTPAASGSTGSLTGTSCP